MSAIITVNGSLLGSKFRYDVTESRGVRSHPFIAHSDHRGARDPVDFSVTSIFLFPAVSRVINVIASRRSASAVPARDARTSTRASRRGVVVDGIGTFGTSRVSESRSSAPGDAAPLTGRTRRSAASLEVRDAHFDSSCFDIGLSRLRDKAGCRFSRHSTDRTGELLAPCFRASADRDRAVCPTSLPRRIIMDVTSDDESGWTIAVTLTQRNFGHGTDRDPAGLC